jgi:hypothetical protein
MAKSSNYGDGIETRLTSEQFRLYCRQQRASVQNLVTGTLFQCELTLRDGSKELWTRQDDGGDGRITGASWVKLPYYF